MRSLITRYLSVLCICLGLGLSAKAQDASRIYIEPSGWSIGMNLGLSDLWGNVGTRSPIDHYANSKYFNKVAFMGGMFGRYTIHPALGVRFQLNYGTLYATDQWNYDKARVSSALGDDAVQRYLRNQNVKDIVGEGLVSFEFVPMRWNPESRLAHRKGQPFIGLGFGYMHFTPYSTIGNGTRYVETENLDLNGQGWGAGYPPALSLWQPVVPLTIGYRWDLGKHLNLGIEYMYRLTFTDQIDGVAGNYITLAQYQQHLSPGLAAEAYQVENKQQFSPYGLPLQDGAVKGNTKNDGYSTITITFYYKVLSRTREWWHE